MDSAVIQDLKPHDEIPLDPRYAGLRNPYHTPVLPTPLPQPRLMHFNAPLATELGLDADDAGLIDILSGNRPWPAYAPIASVYAGHQFGAWVPQLGDGRALTIAEIRKPDGVRVELQLKGAGQTPYSRGADGRAVLRSSIREYLCSEAMHALGIPTTRCLSLVTSPEPVQRETVETAAVVCRVAPSFVRFGQFEFFYHRNQHAQLAPLADHVIAENFPHLLLLTSPAERYARWLEEVVERTARLIAQWQSVGFCHGVMNTDNFSILGLTLDYGPFGFLDAFRQHHVCNHSDYEGRYGYDSQPLIGQWNTSRLLQAALPLLSDNQQIAADIVTSIYERYAPAYSREAIRRWADKLGLREVRDGDSGLISRLLTILHHGKSDFTRSFRHLSRVRTDSDAPASGVREEIADVAAFDAWIADYRARLRAESNTDDAERAAKMNRVNPKYVLRNHLAQAAIEKAIHDDDSEIATLMRLLSRPYDEQPAMEKYADAPPDELRHMEISCSS
jgi:serine/tyrosine/threonine adenylyltransferase